VKIDTRKQIKADINNGSQGDISKNHKFQALLVAYLGISSLDFCGHRLLKTIRVLFSDLVLQEK